MADVVAGSVTAFFLFDVAEAIHLERVRAFIGPATEARLAPKPSTPAYVQYHQPPLAIDGQSVGAGDLLGFRIRLKVFDYGVVSVALTQPLPASWEELGARAIEWHEDPRLPAAAEARCRELVERIRPALTVPRREFLAEDYLVFVVTAGEGSTSAETLLARRGDDIARLLRGEREPLSAQEREEVLRHRISYLANDLVIPTWNAAFVYDTEVGAQAAMELLEFANSQLLQFRYYDDLLDTELAQIYGRLQTARWFSGWGSRRYTRAAQHVHALFIDVNELTDRTENALKIAGDLYAARVLALAAARLGLDHWKANVRQKLDTLDDIYRFAVEQTGMARGQFLELTIVLILVFELVLFFMGIME